MHRIKLLLAALAVLGASALAAERTVAPVHAQALKYPMIAYLLPGPPLVWVCYSACPRVPNVLCCGVHKTQ
jgi:hypothetical protein